MSLQRHYICHFELRLLSEKIRPKGPERTRDSLEFDVVRPSLKTILSNPTKVFPQKTSSSSQQLNRENIKI
jgi:hypothetical protein